MGHFTLNEHQYFQLALFIIRSISEHMVLDRVVYYSGNHNVQRKVNSNSQEYFVPIHLQWMEINIITSGKSI